MMKSSIKKKRRFKINKTISIILGIFMLIFLILLYYLNILKIGFTVLITLLFFVLWIILSFLSNNYRVKNKYKRIGIIVSILLLIITIFVDTKIYKTISFMKNIKSSNNEIINYSLVVLKEDNYNKIRDLKNEKIAYIDNLDKIKQNISVQVIYNECSDVNKLYLSLFNNQVKGIIVENSLKSLAEENNSNYATKTKVIYTFSVEEKSEVVVKEVDVTKKNFNIYISGIDTYGSISSVSRSDVNIIATVNPIQHKILLTSIPRDYYVKLHSKIGYRDKLTHAGIYGVDESISTIEDLLGIDINYFIKVNFTSVVDIVDILGGINVYSDYAFTSMNGTTFSKGYNNLNGEKTLSFVRERYAFNDGDRQRGRNQEAVIKALIKKVTNPSILLKYDTLLEKISSKIETNIPEKDILALLKMQINDNINWEIETNNLDGQNSSNYTYSYPNQKLFVMEPNVKSIEMSKTKIKELING